MYFILYSTSIVFATRYCLDGRVWSPIQFSGCTLVSGGVAPFELMTMKLLNATTTNAVQSMETQIASEVIDRLTVHFHYFSSFVVVHVYNRSKL